MRAHDLLHTRHVRFHTTVLLCIVGELDIATAPLLQHAAQTCLTEPTDTVCLDLTGLTFCDAIGRRESATGRQAGYIRIDGLPPFSVFDHGSELPMVYGADRVSGTVPRADLARAAHCEVCRGWGTIITEDWRHELCPVCQTGERPEESVPTPCGNRAC
ncbi:STAS domain-containing protein [Streptomyces sp900105245]|uniref:STAS domain-containing protein n=1 Tax=Streptomyces sp. 900105245 TaxID=3154379 RepID=A0ABV1UKS3_9ACTN